MANRPELTASFPNTEVDSFGIPSIIDRVSSVDIEPEKAVLGAMLLPKDAPDAVQKASSWA